MYCRYKRRHVATIRTVTRPWLQATSGHNYARDTWRRFFLNPPRQHRDRDVRSLTGPGMLSCGVNGQVQFVGRLVQVEGAIHVLIFHIILFVVHASSHSNNSQPPPRHPHPVLGPCQNAVACHNQLEEAKHAAAGYTSNSGSLFDEHSGQY